MIYLPFTYYIQHFLFAHKDFGTYTLEYEYMATKTYIQGSYTLPYKLPKCIIIFVLKRIIRSSGCPSIATILIYLLSLIDMMNNEGTFRTYQLSALNKWVNAIIENRPSYQSLIIYY